MKLFSVSKMLPGLRVRALQPNSKEPMLGLGGGAGQGEDGLSWTYVR